jgi:hypothetical protein
MQFSRLGDLPPWRTTFAEPYRRGTTAVGSAVVMTSQVFN